MLDTATEKNLKKMVKPLLDNAKHYRKIMDDCDMYMVKPNGNKAWLCENWVLLEWDYCSHTNPFESWKLPTKAAAKEYFLEIQNNDNDY
jgi:hypothetical protein